MIDAVKSFIEENIALIEQDIWKEVYEKAESNIAGNVGNFTETMLAAEIHPENYLSELPEYFLWTANIKKFEIPSNVTSIGSYAFGSCSKLTSVNIPDSVTSIGSDAFYNCISLANVTIPESVTNIGNYAFEYCTSLMSVIIPDNVTSIGYRAFYNCSSLTNIAIGNGVTLIDEDVFSDCSSLTSITIPDSVALIKDDAFSNCGDNLVINYQGSKEGWKKIYNSEAFKNTYFICHCNDGDIIKKRY